MTQAVPVDERNWAVLVWHAAAAAAITKGLTLMGRERTWRFVAFCLGVEAMHTTLHRRLLPAAAACVASIVLRCRGRFQLGDLDVRCQRRAKKVSSSN